MIKWIKTKMRISRDLEDPDIHESINDVNVRVDEFENRFEKLLELQAEQLQVSNLNLEMITTILGEISSTLDRIKVLGEE